MAVHNADIARVFKEIADLLELGQENRFRVRVYRNAARVVFELRLDIAGELAQGRALPKLPGIAEELEGEALATTAGQHPARRDQALRGEGAAGFGDRRKAMLEDIAILTGGRAISEEAGLTLEKATPEVLGHAERVLIDKGTLAFRL